MLWRLIIHLKAIFVDMRATSVGGIDVTPQDEVAILVSTRLFILTQAFHFALLCTLELKFLLLHLNLSK